MSSDRIEIVPLPISDKAFAYALFAVIGDNIEEDEGRIT